MQPADLGADECLDPALLSASEDNPFGQTQWRCAEADAGPPSPFDMSTIDPDLLALYPEHNDNSSTRSRVPVDAQNLSLPPPPLQDESRESSTTSGLTTDNTESRTHHDSLRPGAIEERADNEVDSSASCAIRSQSPPPVRTPPRTSALPSDAPQSTSTTINESRDAQSSAPPAQRTPHPRLIIRIPSLAPEHKSPGAKSAPPPQKRARSPTPDSEEDDFAASFMRKRRVAAGML